jgi:hypothetical protein
MTNSFEHLLNDILNSNPGSSNSIPLQEGWDNCINYAVGVSYLDDNRTLAKFITDFAIANWIKSLPILKGESHANVEKAS